MDTRMVNFKGCPKNMQFWLLRPISLIWKHTAIVEKIRDSIYRKLHFHSFNSILSILMTGPNQRPYMWPVKYWLHFFWDTLYKSFPGAGSQHIITLHFSEYLGKTQPAKDSSVAQLIADSTEKKFRFNSLFKGIWKKKQAQYSLDTWYLTVKNV